MRQIIDGKRYDTETAVLIAEYDNGLPISDFNETTERLYRTQKGRWFLHGKGGGLSAWAQANSDGSRGFGQRLEPMTDLEARQWCEDRGIDADLIAEHFAIEDA